MSGAAAAAEKAAAAAAKAAAAQAAEDAAVEKLISQLRDGGVHKAFAEALLAEIEDRPALPHGGLGVLVDWLGVPRPPTDIDAVKLPLESRDKFQTFLEAAELPRALQAALQAWLEQPVPTADAVAFMKEQLAAYVASRPGLKKPTGAPPARAAAAAAKPDAAFPEYSGGAGGAKAGPKAPAGAGGAPPPGQPPTLKGDNIEFPVMTATSEIQKLAASPLVKDAALKELHRLHREATLHHFSESDMVKQLAAWRVSVYAVEPTMYGPNYFMKVLIGDGLAVLIRVHKQQHHDIWDFHSLHKRIVQNTEHYVWPETDPLVFFNY